MAVTIECHLRGRIPKLILDEFYVSPWWIIRDPKVCRRS